MAAESGTPSMEPNDNSLDGKPAAVVNSTTNDDNHGAVSVTLKAKFGKERIELTNLAPSMTIGEVKLQLQERTRVLPKRQKLVGLIAQQGGAKGVTDDLPLEKLKIKGGSKATAAESMIVEHQFILMGTPEEQIFVDPSAKDDLPDVVDDFELDFNAGSDEWMQHVANQENLKSFTDKTEIFTMNPFRGKPLLVLDLDHTLLDFNSKTLMRDGTNAAMMKRPFMDEFLTECYRSYDLAVWSQTSWRWLETKLTELGMLTNPGYKFAFVLDKTSMFTIRSTRRDGTSVQHHVKPLQIIWSKLPQFNASNTVHVDDLSRNFALNLGSGIKVTAYHRKKSTARRDAELLALAKYLQKLAVSGLDFTLVNFNIWRDVSAGQRPLIEDEHRGNGDSTT